MPGWLDDPPLPGGLSFCSATRERGADRASRQHLGARAIRGEHWLQLSGVLLHDRLPAFVACGLKEAGDTSECAGDATLERNKCRDHDGSDHCQDDAVLSHRLTFLDRKPGAEVMDQIRERHDDSPPFHNSSARCAQMEKPEQVAEKSTRNPATLEDTRRRPFSVFLRAASPSGQSRPSHRRSGPCAYPSSG